MVQGRLYMMKSLLAAALICVAGPLSAASITIGTQDKFGGWNVFPFSPGAGEDRFQQVWDASNFAGLGKIEITGVNFRLRGGTQNGPKGTFAMSMSTTGVAVNALNTDQTEAGFDSNLGADNSAFATNAYDGGSVSGFLTFNGSYTYDSTMGNLLMDLEISDIVASHWGPAVASTSASGGLFSRSHNLGSGFENYGAVVTLDYEPVSEVPLPASALLLMAGVGALGLTRRRRNAA